MTRGPRTKPLTPLGAKLATSAGIRLLAGLVVFAVLVLMQNGVVRFNTNVWELDGHTPDPLAPERLLGSIERAGYMLRIAMWTVALILLVPLVSPDDTRVWASCVIAGAASLLCIGVYFWFAVSAYLAWSKETAIEDPNSHLIPGRLVPCATSAIAAAICVIAATGALAVLRHLRVVRRRHAEQASVF